MGGPADANAAAWERLHYEIDGGFRIDGALLRQASARSRPF
jgi:hypothetical protein